ncbi:MAG: iron complex outermembrane receptor protein, partial [Enterobacterales bacterium]
NVLNTTAYQDMVADPNCFSMNMVPGYAGGYTPQFGGNITDTSITIGTKGLITSGIMKDWDYDLSAAVGRNEAAFNLQNTLNPSLGLSTPSDFDTGSYIQLEKTFNYDLVKMFDIVNFATGFEWREETFEIVAGEEASWKAGPYADQGFNIGSHGFKGFGPEAAGSNTRRNIGIYTDVEVQATDDLLIGATLRYEDFTTFGNTTDYKLAFQYNLSDDISLRGSHSTGFRAPTVGQANVVNTQTSIIDGNLVQTFIAPPTFPLAAFYGGKELSPEESLSYAFGAVYDNGDFFLTVDWYSVEVTDRLAQTSQIDVLSSDHAALRALGVVNPELISAVTYYANDFDTTTEGVDIVANYSMETMGGNTMLSLAFNYNETTVDQFNEATTSLGKVRRLEEGIPKYRSTFTVSQNWDEIDMFVRLNYFGEYFATHADDTSDWGSEVADSAITIDAQVTYAINDSLNVAVGAKNLFDQEAQKLKLDGAGNPNGGCCGGIYYESGPFDYMGAYYYASLTYNY